MTDSIWQGSAVLRGLLAFFRVLAGLYRESGFHRGICRLCIAIGHGCQNSWIYSVLRRDGVLTRAYPQSRLYRWFSKVLNAPGAGFDWLWRRSTVRGSAVLRFLRAVGQRTWALLALLFALMLVVPHAQWNNIYGFLGIFLITLLYFLGAARRRQPGARLDGKQFSVYFAAYAIVLVLGLVFSVSFGLSLRFFLFHLTCLLTVLLLPGAVRTKRQLRALLMVLAAGLTVCALYGCYQRFAGVEAVASQVDYSLALNAGIPGRVYSFFDNPNNFAEILVMLMPLLLALFCSVRRGRKWIVLLCMVPAVWAMLQTYSRSGWIGLVLAVLIFLAFQNWRLVPVCVILVLLAIPLLPQTMLNRILSIGNTGDSSTMYRFQIYDTLRPMLGDHWFSGVGLGSDTVGEVIRTYPTKLGNNVYPIHSHNTYLQLWLEAGIVAPLAYLGGTFYQMKQGIRAIRRSSKELRYLISAAIGGLTGVMVIAIAEYTWFYPRVMFVFWLLLGILMAATKLAAAEGAPAAHQADRSDTPAPADGIPVEKPAKAPRRAAPGKRVAPSRLKPEGPSANRPADAPQAPEAPVQPDAASEAAAADHIPPAPAPLDAQTDRKQPPDASAHSPADPAGPEAEASETPETPETPDVVVLGPDENGILQVAVKGSAGADAPPVRPVLYDMALEEDYETNPPAPQADGLQSGDAEAEAKPE